VVLEQVAGSRLDEASGTSLALPTRHLFVNVSTIKLVLDLVVFGMLPWDLGTSLRNRRSIMTGTSEKPKVERVQLGVRMEKHMVQVLKGLAELKNTTLGELLEKIVLHSFDPVKGDEGESSASPHSKSDLRAIADLRRVYGMDYEVHATRDFAQDVKDSTEDEN
jgi:hypothetical protein